MSVLCIRPDMYGCGEVETLGASLSAPLEGCVFQSYSFMFGGNPWRLGGGKPCLFVKGVISSRGTDFGKEEKALKLRPACVGFLA